MSTVRRLYFYALSLISMLVVVWGVVGLLRTVVSSDIIGGSLLATGLSLVLVGLPIFLVHWLVAQRDAQREVEERSSRIRAVFLYAALGSTLGPIVYALLAMLDRELVRLLGDLGPYSAWMGANQSLADNLIAIAINAVAAAYFWWVLRADWQGNFPDVHLKDARRLYRYLWLLAGLMLLVAGVYNLLRYLLELTGPDDGQRAAILAGGLTFLVVGGPLWGYFWLLIQSSLEDPAERHSLLRLIVLYAISLAGVIGVLSTAGSALTLLLRWLLGEGMTASNFFQDNSGQLGGLIPLGVVWWYYGRILNQEVAALTDQPRRAALRRLYSYILALLGLAVTFAGLISLAQFLARLIFIGNTILVSYRGMLSGSLSAILVGIPLWLVNWHLMQREAHRKDDVGDHARRSVLRRTYLYLVLFAAVIGAMIFTGQLFYNLFNALLSSQPPGDLGRTVMEMVLCLAIDLALLVYHWNALRQDGRMAQQSLGNLHSNFPTLILSKDEEDAFGVSVVEALQRSTPRLPAAVNPVSRGAPDEAMLAAKAILIPVDMALNPPEALRLWLDEYTGHRILVPLPAEGWTWLGHADREPQDMARDAALAVRQLAEGESVRQAMTSSPWAIAGYILGGLFGLLVLFMIFSMMVSALFR